MNIIKRFVSKIKNNVGTFAESADDSLSLINSAILKGKAKYLWCTSHIGEWYLNIRWDGSYFNINTVSIDDIDKILPISVDHSDEAKGAADDSIFDFGYIR